MTVKDIKELLSQYDDGAEVILLDSSNYDEINNEKNEYNDVYLFMIIQ